MDDVEAADHLARLALEGRRPPIFRLWHFPPNEPWATWALFPDGRLREARWDRGEGFTAREVRLSEEDVHAVRVQARFLDLDPENVGETLATSEFGIEGFADAASVVRWDRPVPRGLHAIAAWHSRARACFQAWLKGKC